MVWKRLDGQQPLSETPVANPRQIWNGDRDVAKPHPPPSRVPSVRSTRLGDENIDKQNGKPGLFQNIGDGSQCRDTDNARLEESQTLQRPILPVQARRFHLLANSFLSPSHVKAGHGIQKQTKKGKQHLLVLTETQKASCLTQLTDPGQSSMLQDAPSSDMSSTPGPKPTLVQNVTRPLKRPNRTAEEMIWRAEAWNKPRVSEEFVPQLEDNRQGAGDHLSVAQAQTMDFSRQLAFQEASSRPQEALALAAKSALKVQPEPPTPRSQRHPSHGDTTHDGTREIRRGSTGNDEYVIDIYAPLRDTQIEDIDWEMQPDRVGVIEIEDSDLNIWQEYLEDVDDDKDWDSEDEDENGEYVSYSGLVQRWPRMRLLIPIAEDYYGNDYPEDELDSDDEFDREVYKYRNGASDDEEFDRDYAECSGEESG